MTDNLQQILPLLNFETGVFYCVMIRKRRKDNPGMKVNNQTMLTKHYRTKDKFLSDYSMLKNTCKLHNARLYIDLRPKWYPRAVYNMSQAMAEIHIDPTASLNIESMFFSSMAKANKGRTPYFLIDFDGPESYRRQGEFISIMTNLKAIDFREYETFRTKTGYHILSNRYHTDNEVVIAKTKHLDYEVKKEPIVNLFIP